jgi:hypothetical protein
MSKISIKYLLYKILRLFIIFLHIKILIHHSHAHGSYIRRRSQHFYAKIQ